MRQSCACQRDCQRLLQLNCPHCRPLYHRSHQYNENTDGYQCHSCRVPLKPCNGFNASMDIFSAIRRRGGTRCSGIFFICHRQKNPPIFPTVLTFQPFQYTLVTQGLDVILCAIGAIPQKGIAPMDTPKPANHHAPYHIFIFEMEHFMEQHFSSVSCSAGNTKIG